MTGSRLMDANEFLWRELQPLCDVVFIQRSFYVVNDAFFLSKPPEIKLPEENRSVTAVWTVFLEPGGTDFVVWKVFLAGGGDGLEWK